MTGLIVIGCILILGWMIWRALGWASISQGLVAP